MKKTVGWIMLLLLLSLVLLPRPGVLAESNGYWVCAVCGRTFPENVKLCPYCFPNITAAKWPVLALPDQPVKLRSLGDASSRHQAYYGPGKSYPDAGAYKPGTAKKVNALFRDGEFILVDMDYQTAGRSCLYFRYSAVEGTVTEEMPSTPVPAKTASLVMPTLGPGPEYLTLVQSTPSKYADWDIDALVSKFAGSEEINRALQPVRNTVYLEPDTDVNVFFETNGWVFAEFQCPVGLVRAWIQAAQLK